MESEEKSLKQMTAFHRNCEFVNNRKQKGGGHYVERQEKSKIEIRTSFHTADTDKWGLYQTLEEYLKNPDVLIIYKRDIKPTERIREVPNPQRRREEMKLYLRARLEGK